VVFYFVRVSMSHGLTSVLHVLLCCPSFYVTWSHFRCACISMLSEFLYQLVSPSFCMYFYVVRVWSHFRSVLVFMLSEFLYHLVFLPFCIGLYVFRVSMSLGLTSVLYGVLCCPSFYVTWSHFRPVLVFMFSEFLCHLV